jgi:hypothetical protein
VLDHAGHAAARRNPRKDRLMFLPPFLREPMLHGLMREVANKRDPDQLIQTHDGRPYMRRWHVTPKGDGPACYLHHFLASDDDRAPHDHPWPSVGILLSGEYREHVRTAGIDSVLHRRAGDMIYRSVHWTHRVELLRHPETGAELEVWTLFLVGDRLLPWGFHCPQGWVPWQEFEKRGADGRSVGCG